MTARNLKAYDNRQVKPRNTRKYLEGQAIQAALRVAMEKLQSLTASQHMALILADTVGQT